MKNQQGTDLLKTALQALAALESWVGAKWADRAWHVDELEILRKQTQAISHGDIVAAIFLLQNQIGFRHGFKFTGRVCCCKPARSTPPWFVPSN